MRRGVPEAAIFELGSTEWAALPDLGVPAVLVKIDTGARTSALHATNIDIYADETGQRVRFVVQPASDRPGISRSCDAPLVARRWIASSNGARELRCVVATTIRIGDRRWPIEVTLTNRRSMRFSMLLGQRGILDDMVVVPRYRNLHPEIGYGVYDEQAATGDADAGPAQGEGQVVRTRPRQDGRRELRIGLLGVGPVGPFWQRLADAALARGHIVERIDVSGSRLLLPGARIEAGDRPLPRLDGLIAAFDPREEDETGRGPSVRSFGLALLRQIGSSGAFVLNRAEELLTALDAHQVWPALSAGKIPVVVTAMTAQGVLRDPAVRRGGEARPESALVHALVAGDRVIASACAAQARPSPDKGSRRARLTAIALTPAERRLAVRAAQVLRLGFVCIDLSRHPGARTAVAGVDVSPAIEPLMACATRDAGVAVIKAIEARVAATSDRRSADGA